MTKNHKGCYFSEGSMTPACRRLWDRAEAAEKECESLKSKLDEATQATAIFEKAVEMAMKEICDYCKAGAPTDKNWERRPREDPVDRKGLYHPLRMYYGLGYGGGYTKCKAWRIKDFLQKSGIRFLH